jgi:hypothetical protein
VISPSAASPAMLASELGARDRPIDANVAGARFLAVPVESPDMAAGRLATMLVGLPAGRMKSALDGAWLGHAVHPILVVVPIGAWTSATVLDLVVARQRPREPAADRRGSGGRRPDRHDRPARLI